LCFLLDTCFLTAFLFCCSYAPFERPLDCHHSIRRFVFWLFGMNNTCTLFQTIISTTFTYFLISFMFDSHPPPPQKPSRSFHLIPQRRNTTPSTTGFSLAKLAVTGDRCSESRIALNMVASAFLYLWNKRREYLASITGSCAFYFMTMSSRLMQQ
jgi:hypothetical protein